MLLTLIFASTSVNAAELQPWYKEVLQNDNPNNLGFYADAGKSCELDKTQLRKIVEGVLIRSRIKPLDISFNEIYLNAKIRCTSEGSAFSIAVSFGKAFPGPSILYDVDYGGIGTHANDPSYILSSLKGAIETAVTDYISVNFDL
jgi:hypothetical protein